MKYNAAVITISDKGAKGERIDTSGPALCEILKDKGYDVVYTNIIPDEKTIIEQELVKCSDELKIALEMVLRGYKFRQIDLNKSLAKDFVIAEDKQSVYLPFITIPSLGEAVANSIIEARNVRPFSSKKDFERRTSINKTQFAKLQLLGVFDDLPDDDANSLF
jgi:DNA polymerase III alpha subunit (gram-positive type)